MLLLCLLLPQWALAEGPPRESPYRDSVTPINPGGDLWREIRQRDGAILDGTTQVRGVDSGILINEQGYRWAAPRRLRNARKLSKGTTCSSSISRRCE